MPTGGCAAPGWVHNLRAFPDAEVQVGRLGGGGGADAATLTERYVPGARPGLSGL
jgi:hypothetical protein